MQYLKPGAAYYGLIDIRDGSGKLIAPDSAPTAYVYYKGAKDTSVFPLTVGAPIVTGLYPVTGTTASSYAALDDVKVWTDFAVAGVNYSFQVDEINILVFTAGVVGTVAQLVGLLSASNISILSPVVGGNVTIFEKNSYLAADGRALQFGAPSGANWPSNLTGWTITFTATKTAQNTSAGTAIITATGSVLAATPPGQQVQVELTAALTAGLAVGMGTKGYIFDIVATNGADRATLVSGVMSVVGNVTP